MPSRYPLHMYHATAASPVYAMNQQEENKYAQAGYQERYIMRDYPRNIHHKSGGVREVKNAAEESDFIGEGATHPGWSRTPFPKEEVTETEAPASRSKETRLEIDNYHKIQELEFDLASLKDKYDKLFEAATAQADYLTALSSRVDALTPKKKEKEPATAAS